MMAGRALVQAMSFGARAMLAGTTASAAGAGAAIVDAAQQCAAQSQGTVDAGASGEPCGVVLSASCWILCAACAACGSTSAFAPVVAADASAATVAA